MPLEDQSICIIQSVRTPEYEMQGATIDLTRKTGVLIRQSKKGADVDSRESRLRQESLVPVAVRLRGEVDAQNIILYDEGSGVSGTKGYDQRPQLSHLYLDIANGVIGSIVVARADRLFRDKHFRNVSMFTEIAERQHILLIVPGRAVYDFTKTRDLQAFQREMQEAYSYIATQVAYMHDTRMQKVQRGRYGGGNLPAPYAIDKTMWKDQQVPVIYRPWQPIAVDLFHRLKEYDYVLARIARYIEDQPYIFPYPSAEDLQRYMFKTRMRTVPSGYTFSSADSIRYYFSNLSLAGYAKVGRNDAGAMLYLANAFEAAVPLDLVAESYSAITGRNLDGTACKRRSYATRSRSTSQSTSSAILHGILQSDNGSVSYYANNRKSRPVYMCHVGTTGTEGWVVRNRVGIMRQQKAWSIPCEDLDHLVLKRLCELSTYDCDMSDRVRAFWEQRKTGKLDELRLLDKQIEKAEAQIRRLDKLLTDPEMPLTPDSERRYLGQLREAEAERDRLIRKQVEQDRQRDPEDVVPNFYTVLARLPSAYKELSPEGQKRMARHVIQDIRLNMLSSHVLLLHVTWQTGIASCPDVALVWRGMSPNTGEEWTNEEDAIMRSLYSSASQVELMQALPQRAWNRILERAQVLNLRRSITHAGPHPFNTYHRTMRFDDLEAAAHLVEDPEQQERLRHVVNTLAKQTVRGGLSAHWWLPLDTVSYAGSTVGQVSPQLPMLNVSAVPSESHRRV